MTLLRKTDTISQKNTSILIFGTLNFNIMKILINKKEKKKELQVY